MKFLDRIFSRKNSDSPAAFQEDDHASQAGAGERAGTVSSFHRKGGWTKKMRVQLDKARNGDKQAYVHVIESIFENPIPINNPRMSLKEVTLLLSCNPRFTPPREIEAVETAAEYQKCHEELSGLLSEMKQVIAGFPSSGISRAQIDTICDAAGYELHISNSTSMHSHAGGYVPHLDVSVDISKSKSAVEQICMDKSPHTTNILHKIQHKHDFSIQTGTCTSYTERKVGFSDEREMAKMELQQRGNPRYDPDNYFLK